jgi:iron complex outermembrane receptor protein
VKTKDLFLRGNISGNYNYPSLNDLYWQPGGNPDLEPEKGISYELGMVYKHNKESFRLSTGINTYYNNIDNWIIWLPTFKGYWEPANICKVIAKGIEIDLSIKGKLNEFDYSISGTYAYTSSVNRGREKIWGEANYNRQLPYIPLHSGNVFGSVSWRNFTMSYQFNSYSKRYTSTANDQARRNYIYAYYMNSMSVGKQFNWRKLRLSTQLKIYNLFNETYHSVLYRPMPGRNYMLLIIFEI